MKLEPRSLAGKHVRLDPLEPADREEIRTLLASDPDNWAVQTLCAVGEHFDAYWNLMTSEPRRITFAVRDLATGRLAGTSSFLDIAPAHRNLEIGYTFFHPDFRGTAVNPETKLLMLAEAFDAGALRVQFSVSAANARSRAAMLKLGARQEGILRHHRLTWTGALRDTSIFAILAEEWPEVEQGLEARLDRS